MGDLPNFLICHNLLNDQTSGDSQGGASRHGVGAVGLSVFQAFTNPRHRNRPGQESEDFPHPLVVSVPGLEGGLCPEFCGKVDSAFSPAKP